MTDTPPKDAPPPGKARRRKRSGPIPVFQPPPPIAPPGRGAEAAKGPGGLETVFVARPRCPHCGGAEVAVRRSIRQGDGSTLRYCLCRSCDRTFKMVLE